LESVIPQLTKVKQLAISVQRVAKIAVLRGRDFCNFLRHGLKKYARILIDKIRLFANDIFDPNFRHRDSSLARVTRLIEGLS
jgi:hypothetical protein